MQRDCVLSLEEDTDKMSLMCTPVLHCEWERMWKTTFLLKRYRLSMLHVQIGVQISYENTYFNVFKNLNKVECFDFFLFVQELWREIIIYTIKIK